MNTCVTCGHDKEEHLLITTSACTKCECLLFKAALPFQIRTVLSDVGVSRVSIEYGSTNLQLTADAAVQIGMELISAGYAARGEKALYEYAMQHGLDLNELIKLER